MSGGGRGPRRRQRFRQEARARAWWWLVAAEHAPEGRGWAPRWVVLEVLHGQALEEDWER